MSDGQKRRARLRRFGWKAFLLAAVVVAMVWLVVAQRARIVESLGLLAHANWWWVGAAVVAQAVSMGAMARQQRRLLGVGGSRISLAGVVATTYAGNAISVGLPLAGPAAATVFAMRRFVYLGAEASVAGWALAVSGVFSSFALVAVVALGAVVSGSGLAVVSAAVGVLGGAVPLAVLLLSLRRPGPRRLLEQLGTRLVAGVQKVSGNPQGDPEEIVQEQLEEVTALEPDRPTLWIAALLAALNWLADAACLAFAILAVGGDVPWEGLLLAWAAGTAVASLGLTPGGLGVVEAALSSALIATGLVGSTAIASRAGLPDREPVAGARGGRAHAAGARRPEARHVGRDRRPGRPGAVRLKGRGGQEGHFLQWRHEGGLPATASAAGRPPRGRRQQAPVADGQQPGQLVHDHGIAADQHARTAAVHGAQDDLRGVGRVQGQQLVEPVAAQPPTARPGAGCRRSRCARCSSAPRPGARRSPRRPSAPARRAATRGTRGRRTCWRSRPSGPAARRSRRCWTARRGATPGCAVSTGSSARVIVTTAWKFTAITASNWAASTWSNRPASATPALLISRVVSGWAAAIAVSRGDGGRGVREVGDVLGDPHPGRHRPGRGGDRGEAVGVAVQQHEVAAAGGEPGGQRRADPARGTGDHRGAALERVPAHHATPRVVSGKPRSWRETS